MAAVSAGAFGVRGAFGDSFRRLGEMTEGQTRFPVAQAWVNSECLMGRTIF